MLDLKTRMYASFTLSCLGKARRTRDIHPSTLCNFEPPSVHDSDTRHASAASEMDVARELAGVEDDDHVGTTPLAATADVIHVGPWVNQTPLSVAPQLPLEVVMDLFKRMG